MSKNEIELSQFKGIEVDIDMDSIIEKYGKQAAEYLRTNPSNPKIKEHRKTKEYFSTWRYRYDKGIKTATVYNKQNGSLTYLLEKGHFIVNKKGGVGRAAPHPHIAPTFEKFKNKFAADMENAGIEVKFK